MTKRRRGHLPNLPEDQLIEILLKLPAKSLLRFKSVCKSWLSHIESSDFVLRHATTLSNNSEETFIVKTRERKDDGTGMDNRPRFFLLSGVEFDVVEELGVPHYYQSMVFKDPSVIMVGSCHGIVAMYDEVTRDVALWNPATKQFRMLPESLSKNPRRHPPDLIALGFDVQAKDYKVLRVIFLGNDDPDPFLTYAKRLIQVYTLSTDSWRFIDDTFPTHVADINVVQGRYLNGHYFCMGINLFREEISEIDNSRVWTPCGDATIVSFDFTKEIFTAIQVPDDRSDRRVLAIDFIGEKIACIKMDLNMSIYEVWVCNFHRECCLKDYSWTKLYDIDGEPAIDIYLLWPMGLSRNGEVAFRRHITGLELCNLLTYDTVKVIQFGKDLNVQQIDVYSSSIVSITGNGSAVANKE